MTVLLVGISAGAASALNIQFNEIAPLTTAQRNAFESAATAWESTYADPITVTLNIGFDNLTDSDFNPYQPLNLANGPPFSRILPRCPSISPASWGDRTGLCYDPGRPLGVFSQSAQIFKNLFPILGRSVALVSAMNATTNTVIVDPIPSDYLAISGDAEEANIQLHISVY